MTTQNLLAIEIKSRELNRKITFKQYFILLAETVWREGECFSGKRPWGNSSWQYELYGAMIQNGIIAGRIDEDGCVEEVDESAADKLIFEAMAKWRDEA